MLEIFGICISSVVNEVELLNCVTERWLKIDLKL